MDVGALVTRKIGPLPVWAYGAIIAFGAWAYYWYTGRNGDSTGTGVPDSDVSDSGVPDESGSTIGSGNGSTQVARADNTPTSNEDWRQKAAATLVSLGYDGVTVNNALTRYLTEGSTDLSVVERMLVGLAIGRWGVPPEGVPVGVPDPTPTPGRKGNPVPRRPRRNPVPTPPRTVPRPRGTYER